MQPSHPASWHHPPQCATPNLETQIRTEECVSSGRTLEVWYSVDLDRKGMRDPVHSTTSGTPRYTISILCVSKPSSTIRRMRRGIDKALLMKLVLPVHVGRGSHGGDV